MSPRKPVRRYRKGKRAVQERETRVRITEALVELHGTVGPARTTVTEVADRAGVSRVTVYNHFPDDEAMFSACSAHWFERHPVPDPSSWSTESDTVTRRRVGLGALYRWYADAADMMENVLRDAALVPAVSAVLDDTWRPYLDQVVSALSDDMHDGDRAADAPLRVAVDFHTWKILSDAGLDTVDATAVALRLTECADP